MTEISLAKRNRMERMIAACTLLSSIWEEVKDCEAEDIGLGLLQIAVNAQVDINRIVWKLNELKGAYPKADRKTEPTGYNLLPVEDEPQTDCPWK